MMAVLTSAMETDLKWGQVYRASLHRAEHTSSEEGQPPLTPSCLMSSATERPLTAQQVIWPHPDLFSPCLWCVLWWSSRVAAFLQVSFLIENTVVRPYSARLHFLCSIFTFSPNALDIDPFETVTTVQSRSEDVHKSNLWMLLFVSLAMKRYILMLCYPILCDISMI